MVIWKYTINSFADEQTLMLPKKLEVVHAGLDADEKTCIWVRLESAMPKARKKIRIIGTGVHYDDNWVYAFTWHNGPFIWHLLLHKDFYDE